MENTDGVASAAFIAQDSNTAASSWILEIGPASPNPSQEGLPSVVALDIFQYLELHALLKCRLVCSGFQYLIDSTASFQYKIELAVAGQQDGSYGDMFTRREMLKMHQKRWDGLEWTEILRVPMRMPSQSRGIKEKNWILDLSTLLGEDGIMGKFGMDPGQDLLVIIASADNSLRIHLLTLSKGECHPLTSEPYLVPHESYDLGHGPFSFDICHDFISIHSLFGAMIWNWKTGQVLMHIVSYEISSMVFLNERYVLMAITRETHPYYLLAIDFLAEPPEQRDLYELENSFIFRFPEISPSPVARIIIRSNPRSTWGAGTDPSVPFSLVPQNRVFVVHLLSNHIDENLYFAILEASFLSLIKTGLRVNNNSFDWSMWGPEHSRALPNYPYSPPWLVPSHGTRLVMKRYVPHRGILIDVYDFNQLGCRNKKQDSDVETSENVNVSERSEIIEGRPVCVLGPTKIKANIFCEIDTRLGYSVSSWSRSVSGKTHASSISVICSEDAIILEDTTNDMYEIYTV